MKELWKERLQRIENLNDRRLLRGILTGAFEQLESYTDKRLNDIEERVFAEIEDIESDFDIYCSMVSMEEYDPINDFLFPIVSTDPESDQIAISEIKEAIEKEERPILDKIYLDMDYLSLKAFKDTLKNRKFKGNLKTNKNDYPIEVSLHPHQGYEQQLERLYHIFLENDLPWRTVFHPFIYKFMNIQLETGIIFQERESIEEITFNLEEVELYKKVNQIPLWNIRSFVFENASFPIPAFDRINYEHHLNLGAVGEQHGYLVDSTGREILFVQREKDGIRIISPIEEVMNWNILQIVKPDTSLLADYFLFSNRRKELFTDRFARRENRVIRSEGEIRRILHSLVASDGIGLSRIEIHEPGKGNEETYNTNSFIKDNIRKDGDKKVLLLSFTAYEKPKDIIEDKLLWDRVSFLVSVVQLYFPEFKCIGELV